MKIIIKYVILIIFIISCTKNTHKDYKTMHLNNSEYNNFIKEFNKYIFRIDFNSDNRYIFVVIMDLPAGNYTIFNNKISTNGSIEFVKDLKSDKIMFFTNDDFMNFAWSKFYEKYNILLFDIGTSGSRHYSFFDLNNFNIFLDTSATNNNDYNFNNDALNFSYDGKIIIVSVAGDDNNDFGNESYYKTLLVYNTQTKIKEEIKSKDKKEQYHFNKWINNNEFSYTKYKIISDPINKSKVKWVYENELIYKIK